MLYLNESYRHKCYELPFWDFWFCFVCTLGFHLGLDLCYVVFNVKIYIIIFYYFLALLFLFGVVGVFFKLSPIQHSLVFALFLFLSFMVDSYL